MADMKTQIEAIVVVALLGAAICYDMTTDKVPNRLIITGYVLAAIMKIHAPPDTVLFFVKALWPVVLLYPLFLIRGLGAGDIKLFSVLSTFISTANLVQIMVFSLFIASGIIFVHWFVCFIKKESKYVSRIHYTLCIFAAYAVTLCFPDVFFDYLAG